MAAADVQAPPAEPAPGLPDYMTDPNAVLQDISAKWRYGQPPDYSKTRKFMSETKKSNHEAGSLPELVQNLVKNWEIEASFKPQLSDWRTVNHDKYTFAINGGPPQTAEHMLKVGTYNAIITAPNEYYSNTNSDFASSHKTFKRMMPTFAWEVMEVYSGPPRVAFKWRHWGVMKNDYVGFNGSGEKVTAKAHGGLIDIHGVTVAEVDDKMRVTGLETWFDPLEMFRQIAPKGVVSKQPIDRAVDFADDGHEDEHEPTLPDSMEDKSTGLRTIVTQPIPNEHTPDNIEIVKGGASDTNLRFETDAASSTPDPGRSKVQPTSMPEPKAHEKSVKTINTDKNNDNTKPRKTGAADLDSADILEPRPTGSEANGAKADAKSEQYVNYADAVAAARGKSEIGGTAIPESRPVAEAGAPGEAVATPADSARTRDVHEEMSRITPSECPFFNRE